MQSIEPVRKRARDTYRKVFDSRKRRVRGLWQRNGRFFANITGCREKEALAIRWGDIDLARGIVTIGADPSRGAPRQSPCSCPPIALTTRPLLPPRATLGTMWQYGEAARPPGLRPQDLSSHIGAKGDSPRQGA